MKQEPKAADDAPSLVWQNRARGFIAMSQARLWWPEGAKALAYLGECRGLSDETIRRWHLGYNPQDAFPSGANWGAPDTKVWLPRGITIPCEVDGVLWYVKVRRPLPDDPKIGHDALADYLAPVDFKSDAKYISVKGGIAESLFGADLLAGHSAVLLAEGEFDVMLADQEAGDLAGVATFGSASNGIPDRWLWSLIGKPIVLAAFDLDEAGDRAAVKIKERLGQVRTVKPLGGKDLTAMHQAGGNLRRWLSYHLANCSGQQEATSVAQTVGKQSTAILWDAPYGDDMTDAHFQLICNADIARFGYHVPTRRYREPVEAPEAIWERLGLLPLPTRGAA